MVGMQPKHFFAHYFHHLLSRLMEERRVKAKYGVVINNGLLFKVGLESFLPIIDHEGKISLVEGGFLSFGLEHQ